MTKNVVAYAVVVASMIFAWVSLFVLRKQIRTGFVASLVALTAFGITGLFGVIIAGSPVGKVPVFVPIAALVFLAIAFGSIAWLAWLRRPSAGRAD